MISKFLAKEKAAVTIVMVDGGFCSVLVKYALGKCLEKSGKKVKYDLSWFDENGMDCDGEHMRKFELLNIFPQIAFEVASKEESDYCKKKCHYHNPLPYRFNEDIFKIKKPIYLDGYYENWQYMDLVREEQAKQQSSPTTKRLIKYQKDSSCTTSVLTLDSVMIQLPLWRYGQMEMVI